MKIFLLIGSVLCLIAGVDCLVDGKTGWGIVLVAFGVMDFVLFAKAGKQNSD